MILLRISYLAKIRKNKEDIMTIKPKNIAILGSGIMGEGLAINLLKAGHTVRLFVRSIKLWKDLPKDLQEVLNSKNCSQHLSLRESIFGSELIVLCLTEDEIVEQIFFNPDLLKANPKWIIDTGTTSPELTMKMYESCNQRGIQFLDSPMTGSKMAARNGQILFMVGADEVQIKELQFFFEACGKKTIHCGSIGSGQGAKIALNMIQAGLFQIYIEGFILAEKEGIDPKIFLDIIENSAAASPLLSFKLNSVLNQDYSAHFALKNMNKDLNHAMKRSREHHIVLPVASQLKPIYEAGILAGFEEEDFSSLAKVNQLWNTKSIYKT
jgi:3-hydroxyisobutyrate dehydrogenase